MTSGRSGGSVVCAVLAMLSLAGAIICTILAGAAATLVSNEPGEREFNHETSDVGAPAYKRWSEEESQPFDDAAGCTTDEDSPPDQEFLACVADIEKEAQEDASAWAAVVAARQADIQQKGDMAITFGLVGVTFAVFAVALVGSRPATPQPATSPATDEPLPAAQATVPARETDPADAPGPGPGHGPATAPGPADGPGPAHQSEPGQEAYIEWGQHHKPD